MDDETVKVNYRHNGMILELDCGISAFARFKELIRVEAKLSDPQFERACTIAIVDMGNRPPRKTTFRDIVHGVGCALILALSLGVFGVGMHTIWRWLVLP